MANLVPTPNIRLTCVTISQPYAIAFCLGEFAFDVRGWTTQYRGPLAIHAADAYRLDAKRAGQYGRFPEIKHRWAKEVGTIPFGAIIGQVDLVNICSVGDMARAGRGEILKNYVEQNWTDPTKAVWEYANPVVYDRPIPMKGKPGIWKYFCGYGKESV